MAAKEGRLELGSEEGDGTARGGEGGEGKAGVLWGGERTGSSVLGLKVEVAGRPREDLTGRPVSLQVCPPLIGGTRAGVLFLQLVLLSAELSAGFVASLGLELNYNLRPRGRLGEERSGGPGSAGAAPPCSCLWPGRGAPPGDLGAVLLALLLANRPPTSWAEQVLAEPCPRAPGLWLGSPHQVSPLLPPPLCLVLLSFPSPAFDSLPPTPPLPGPNPQAPPVSPGATSRQVPGAPRPRPASGAAHGGDLGRGALVLGEGAPGGPGLA